MSASLRYNALVIDKQTAHHAAPMGDRLALRTWLRMLGCTGTIERHVRKGLRHEFETTLPRFDVLAQLDAAQQMAGEIRREGLTMSELSKRLMVTNGNLTGLVDRLVREGLVDRTPGPTDRRIQMIRLTRVGKHALDAMMTDHHAWITEMFSGLSPNEQLKLHTLLGKLKRSLTSLDEESANV